MILQIILELQIFSRFIFWSPLDNNHLHFTHKRVEKAAIENEVKKEKASFPILKCHLGVMYEARDGKFIGRSERIEPIERIERDNAAIHSLWFITATL